MSLKKEQDSDTTKGLCKLAIDEDMTIYAIESLKQGISSELEVHDQFELNLAQVEEIDSAGIQLLLALRSELLLNQKAFKLTAMSSVVANLIDQYGVGDRLNTGVAP